jgi:hypothetical protein
MDYHFMSDTGDGAHLAIPALPAGYITPIQLPVLKEFRRPITHDRVRQAIPSYRLELLTRLPISPTFDF